MSQAIPQPTQLVNEDFPTEILLIRHGRSADVVPGSPESADPPLADVGVEQAIALARRLAPKRLDAIFASDLQRAMATAGAIAEGRDIEVQINPDLREVFLGEWENGEYRRRAAVRDPQWVAHARAGRWDLVPGGEGDDALRTRVRGAVAACVAGREGGTVAIVCHGGVINAYLASIWGVERSFLVPTENTGVTIVRLGDNRQTVIIANDCAHLYDPVFGP